MLICFKFFLEIHAVNVVKSFVFTFSLIRKFCLITLYNVKFITRLICNMFANILCYNRYERWLSHKHKFRHISSTQPVTGRRRDYAVFGKTLRKYTPGGAH